MTDDSKKMTNKPGRKPNRTPREYREYREDSVRRLDQNGTDRNQIAEGFDLSQGQISQDIKNSELREVKKENKALTEQNKTLIEKIKTLTEENEALKRGLKPAIYFVQEQEAI